jgi:hypothetical protein
MNSKIVYTLKVSLVILLGLCFFDMPYNFYQFLRYWATITFFLLCCDRVISSKYLTALVYFTFALVFQPFVKINIEREQWLIVDFFTICFLVLTLIPIKNLFMEHTEKTHTGLSLRQKKFIAKEVLILFSIILIVLLSWGFLEMRNNYYKAEFDKIQNVETITDIYDGLSGIMPDNLKNDIIAYTQNEFIEKMKSVENQELLYSKLKNGYYYNYSNGNQSERQEFDFEIGTRGDFLVRIEYAIKSQKKYDEVTANILTDNRIQLTIIYISIILLSILYPLRILYSIIAWSIKTLKS